MGKKKRVSAAARAAKARATRVSNLKKKQEQQEHEPVEDDEVEDTSADVTDQNEGTEVGEGIDEMEVAEGDEVPATSASELDAESPVKQINDEASGEETEVNGEDEETTEKSEVTGQIAEAPEEDLNGEDGDEDENYYVRTLYTMANSLVDPAKGFKSDENLKKPLTHFKAEDEVLLFPVIETMSSRLFTMVQSLMDISRNQVQAGFAARKGIIRLPGSKYKIFLCKPSLMDPPPAKPTPAKRPPHPFLLNEDECHFSEEKLKILRAPLDAGWKREVVMRSSGSTGRKKGDVYYYQPKTNKKFRSIKEIEKCLMEMRNSPFTVENFSFAKVRIGTNEDQEIIRKAYDGKSPPRAPPKTAAKGKVPSPPKGGTSKLPARPSTSGSKESVEDTREEPVKMLSSSRRSIQPPKRYSGESVLLLQKRPKMQEDKKKSNANQGLMQMGMLPPKYPKGMEDTSSNVSDSLDYNELTGSNDDLTGGNSVAMKEIAEDSLFQISALRQSGGIDVDNMTKLVESQKQMAQRPSVGPTKAGQPGSSKGGATVIPCSIRCAGMEGAVPNLQCDRCLCMFHAECLGYPSNVVCKKYLCNNCAPTSGGPCVVPKGTIVKKVGEAKRSPPGLVTIPHAAHLPRPVAPVGRESTITVTSKETITRLPHRMHPNRPPYSGMSRGIVRGRGGMPPPAQPRPHGAPVQRTMIISSDGTITNLVGNQSHLLKRSRGRPPSVPQGRTLPQLSRNLTITQLPKIGGALPVPNLQPMGTSKGIPGRLPLPVMGGAKPRQTIPAVPKLMKPNAFRLAVPPPALSGRTFKKTIPPPQSQPPTTLRITAAGGVSKQAAVAYTPAPERIISIGKRYPQSICTVGKKKFVVLPKRRPQGFPASTTVTPVGNGTPHKEHAAEIVEKAVSTTIESIVDAIDTAENNVVNDEPVDDGMVDENNGDHAESMETDGMESEDLTNQPEETGVAVAANDYLQTYREYSPEPLPRYLIVIQEEYDTENDQKNTLIELINSSFRGEERMWSYEFFEYLLDLRWSFESYMDMFWELM